MATSVSCIIITTLIVVSLANLLLLVHVIMHTMKHCAEEQVKYEKTKYIDKYKLRPRDGSSEASMENYQASIVNYKFMAALILLNDEDVEFICSVAIISKNLALTPAHCARLIAKQPLSRVRIASNSSKFRYGIWHDLEKVIIHEDYEEFRGYNDIAIVSVRKPFKGKFVSTIALPHSRFMYVANTTAMSLGWTRMKQTDFAEQIYGIDVKLFWHKYCQAIYPDERIFDNGMFCVGKYKNEKSVCIWDYGAQLMQRNVLIGMMAYGIGCGAEEGKPVVYTKIALYENWIRRVEKKYGAPGSALFKIKT